jgi:hypothetical protein
MKTILSGREQPRVDEVERLEAIGVDVKAHGPKLPVTLEQRHRLNEWEKFKRRVQAIMEENRLEDSWLFSQEYGLFAPIDIR